VGPAAWETTNLLTVSTALAEAAALRTETRGSHWREDFPHRDESRAGHVDTWLAVDGTVRAEWAYAPSTDPSTTEVPA
jgi:L-aspartate oxidase